jgi:hypothetical protein
MSKVIHRKRQTRREVQVHIQVSNTSRPEKKIKNTAQLPPEHTKYQKRITEKNAESYI